MKTEDVIVKYIKYDTNNIYKLKNALSELCKEMKKIKDVNK
jgi:hypothetical protein